MRACERGVFVNAGPQSGEKCDSGRGCAPNVFTAIALFLLFLTQIVAICVDFWAFVCF